jgi:hypothetical protein
MPEPSNTQDDLRGRLVAITREWERQFGVAPAITGAVSEYDAAVLLGLSTEQYGSCCAGRTAVSKGHDFTCQNQRYQVKANRPSGKPGSPVTKVAKANNYDWDFLIWILYNPAYEMQEAWLWDVEQYKATFQAKDRICPADMRLGKRLFP